MTIFEDIVSEYGILEEGVSTQSVTNAINGLHPANIQYNSGGENKATGYRLIYPVAYGLTKTGNKVVRAFETGGDTATSNPGWKFFRLDRILSWKNMKREYNPNSPELRGGFEDFNPDGDNSMSVVYSIAPIGNAKKLNRQQTSTIKSEPITKKDVEMAGIQPTQFVSKKNGNYTASDVIDKIISGIGDEKSDKNVDLIANKEYNVQKPNRINAPKTEPVMKKDIQSNDTGTEMQGQESEEDVNNKMQAYDEKPLMKSDFVEKYNDLLGRMDKLNADEEEKQEENT